MIALVDSHLGENPSTNKADWLTSLSFLSLVSPQKSVGLEDERTNER